jgi:hypothetical protein
MNPRNLFAELKDRKVCKVAVTRAVIRWLPVQITTEVLLVFEDPAFLTSMSLP